MLLRWLGLTRSAQLQLLTALHCLLQLLSYCALQMSSMPAFVLQLAQLSELASALGSRPSLQQQQSRNLPLLLLQHLLLLCWLQLKRPGCGSMTRQGHVRNNG